MAGRPKRRKAYKVMLTIPKDELWYRAQRTYWLLREMENKLELDPTAIKLSDYLTALDRYASLSTELKAKGYNSGKARKRMDKPGVVQTGKQTSASDVGDGESAELGAGVPTANPTA